MSIDVSDELLGFMKHYEILGKAGELAVKINRAFTIYLQEHDLLEEFVEWLHDYNPVLISEGEMFRLDMAEFKSQFIEKGDKDE